MSEPAVDEVFASLQPAAVWQHFATLCRIPRVSKHEAALRDHLRAWAEGLGLPCTVDAAGNLLIRKAASPGREGVPGVVLQAHLDMVCQANAGVAHDFFTDPIRPVLRDGWLVAPDTTLGADNGIGVALILAVLAARELAHGPLEALFTVDEEAGMGGAHGLQPGALAGRLMINLDAEAWGEFYVGCAGGLDVDVERRSAPETAPVGWTGHEIVLRGLRGGHSGVDIHEERGNAVKLLVRVLRDVEARLPLRLATLSGGTARNALPREARAVVVLPAGRADEVAGHLADWQSALRAELAGVDEGVALSCSPAVAREVMPVGEQAVWLASLQAAPHGVFRWSRRVPGVVETSNNLGIVDFGPAGGHCNFMVRSLVDRGALALADQIASLFELSASTVRKSGHYPGWAPDPASPLLALCREVYRREFGGESTVQVIHAGLECGIIGAKHLGLDTVSFGPTITGAHAPGEAVEVASVGRCWQLLRAILSAVS
jgi:dipeptidase D